MRKSKRKEVIFIVVLGIITIGALWFFRPWWHSLFMWVYRNPVIAEAIILTYIVLVTILWNSREDEARAERSDNKGICLSTNEGERSKVIKDYDKKFFIGLAISICIFLLIFASLATMFPQREIAKNLQVSRKDSLSDIKETVRAIEKEKKVAQGLLMLDNYRWQLYKKKYRADYEDPYFLVSDDELYAVVSIVTYKYRFRFPVFYTVKKWEGTVLISDSSGNIEFLTPEEARKHPLLINQKLFPERLVRYYINSLKYRDGIINRLFFRKDQFKITKITLVQTGESLEWLIVCEPYRKNGLFWIYLIDARSEPRKIEVIESDQRKKVFDFINKI